MSESNTVLVFTKPESNFELLDDSRQLTLPVDDLRKNLNEFLTSLKYLLPAEEETGAGMKLKVVTVAVGINGKGKIGFLGTGMEVGASSTLTLTFERG
jgi:hypothetical protein